MASSSRKASALPCSGSSSESMQGPVVHVAREIPLKIDWHRLAPLANSAGRSKMVMDLPARDADSFNSQRPGSGRTDKNHQGLRL